ncbi:MAG: MEDS domain-containing protein [Candidatus Eremiobacteraeota bacterium]|nr:MEDS domain-containing protein [Candidatus Eremiobacteraeota bacterium]
MISPMPPLFSGAHSGEHLVHFYGTEESALIESVSAYFAAGLERGEFALAVATPAHASAFVAHLESKGLDTKELTDAGRLVLLDAAATLSRLLVDNYPDRVRFDNVVGGTIRRLLEQNPAGLRAYDEMVGLLWQQSNCPAAIRLEQLWDGLQKAAHFSLFCAYPIDVFHESFDTGVLGALISAHSHLLPAARNGDIQHALDRALDDVMGAQAPAIRDQLAGHGHGATDCSLPAAEASILWLRSNLADRAGDILSRAREHYAGNRSAL